MYDLNVVVSTSVSQRRYAHTDLKVPDFGGYRKDNKSRTVEGGREAGKVFTYVMIGGEFLQTLSLEKFFRCQQSPSNEPRVELIQYCLIEICPKECFTHC